MNCNKSKVCYNGICKCNMFEKYINACATIHVDDSISSGCFINKNRKDGLFLTAYHSVEDIVGNSEKYLYITNPITNEWNKVFGNNIYYDGIADIAIINTGINLTNYSQYTLNFASKEPHIGEDCYLIGNPLGLDTKSVSKGVIRDPHFCNVNGNIIIDILFIDTPGYTGNSGSPIINSDGLIIGLFTYGYNLTVNNIEDKEIGIVQSDTLAGGPNLNTLIKSLNVLSELKNNKEKKFIGLSYNIKDPYCLEEIYNNDNFNNKGLYVTKIHECSPLYSKLCEKKEIINKSDTEWNDIEIILYSVTLNGRKIDFGILPNQRPLGVLCYEYNATEVYFEYYSVKYREQREIKVFLNKTYNDVDEDLDDY